MNAMQRSEYWLKMERMRRVVERKYTPIMTEVLLKEFDTFAKSVKRDGPSAAMSGLGAVVWDTKIMSVMSDMYREVAVQFSNSAYRAVGIESRKAYNPFKLNSTFLAEIMRFLAQYGFYIVAFITQTTKKKLISLVTAAMAVGASVDDIVNLIVSKEMGEYARMRARMIIRTEVMRASNYSVSMGATEHQFQVDKMWVSMRDARTRRIPKDQYDHWDMDGQVRPLDEPFQSFDKLGRVVLADMPGDPKAPKGFLINCRCTVAYVPSRDANGRLINKI
jgi:uncharacterized protein with gpF-like domain